MPTVDEPPPRVRIEAECASRGRDTVAEGCARLLSGGTADERLIMVLGGPGAPWAMDSGPDSPNAYWLRVWGARGLLWAWDERALPALLRGLGDDAWRVREMCAKVVARHLVGDALQAVAGLRDDPVPRVRAAAVRAVARLTAADA
jgi:hypothetical protein